MQPNLNKRQKLALRRISLGGDKREFVPDWSLVDATMLADLTARGLIESEDQTRYCLTEEGWAMLHPFRLH